MTVPPVDDDDELIPTDGPAEMSAYARTREPVELFVKVRTEGMRLDHYLQIFFHERSRSELQEAIKGGHITVNGRAAKASYKVRNDDRLYVQLPEPINDVIVPEDILLDVLYEDECLAVINKPADMVVHPARGNWSGTLANALAFRFKDQLSRANGTFRPGIVHRLDRDTSGAILIAKDEVSHRIVSYQFETRKVFKEYVAITLGELERDSDYVEAALKHDPHQREKMIVATRPGDAEAKEACSYYEVAERFRGYTLVKVQPRTGRTHQIRVHLMHVGCPVLADKMYGSRPSFSLADLVPNLPREQNESLLIRQALHAFRLRVQHPKTNRWLEVEAPLPTDMRRTLEALRSHRPRR